MWYVNGASVFQAFCVWFTSRTPFRSHAHLVNCCHSHFIVEEINDQGSSVVCPGSRSWWTGDRRPGFPQSPSPFPPTPGGPSREECGKKVVSSVLGLSCRNPDAPGVGARLPESEAVAPRPAASEAALAVQGEELLFADLGVALTREACGLPVNQAPPPGFLACPSPCLGSSSGGGGGSVERSTLPRVSPVGPGERVRKVPCPCNASSSENSPLWLCSRWRAFE